MSRIGLSSLLLGTAVFLTAVSLLVALSLPPRGSQEHRAVSRTEDPKAGEVSQTQGERDDPGPSKGVDSRKGNVPASPDSQDRDYEERRDPFRQGVERIDLALVQSLANSGVDLDKLRHVRIDYRKKGQKDYRFQEVELHVPPQKGRRVVQELEGFLREHVSDAVLESLPQAPGNWQIRLKDVVTHRIVLNGADDGEEPSELDDGPRIALVMDDMGNSLPRAKELLRLSGGEIALSVLPSSPYSVEVTRAARNRGADVLLHLPMEPKGYPESDPGPRALFVNMEQERIRSLLRRNMKEVPGLVGVNNHMGSRFTAARSPMREVLTVLRRRDLFYMDSLTNPDSVGAELASRLGVQAIKRDLFLDNKKNVESIRYQLRKAEHLARECGNAVVIGHPYPETIEALRQWLADKDGDVRLCRLSRLVRAQNDLQATRRKADETADSGDN
ncbi:MAG: divergent polysaccharide deacetylase family protein [Desulfohalobiaceae bacterium]|nr:divergent polysaccharide deacetylase family protein [Desulfohalobiaceae bacterium]